jgi:YidC/Oxa1 family membrane protein insertase
VTLQPYGIVARHGLPQLQNIFVVHEGAIQRVDGELTETNYDEFPDFEVDANEGLPAVVSNGTVDGWIGFTDHYWMTTLVPEQGKPYKAVLKYRAECGDLSGRSASACHHPCRRRGDRSSLRFFAGAKEWATIRSYQNDQGIAGFLDSIDWGWFYFLTKPIFAVLHWLNLQIGNMGLAIIALTFFLKFLVLPLAYKSYVSMARMKELQPEMEALKERAGEDRQRLQREMMQLYKDKKVNPAAGCLADPDPDPDLLRALQGDLRHHRTAPCPLRRLAARPFRA